VKPGSLVRYNFWNKLTDDVYGIGILISYSKSGDFAEVLWTRLGLAWSSVKFLELVDEESEE
jgi:hypothetical protein